MQVLDFPLLVNDGGATLRDELGVTSNLHRQQILRGIRRIILGMGQPPSAPQVGLKCGIIQTAQTQLLCTCQAVAVPALYPGRSHHSLNGMSSAHSLQVLTCKPLSCTSAALTWKAPEILGHPPMHKYKLERQLLAKGAQQTGQGWVTAEGDVDHEAHSVVDANAKVRGPVTWQAA